MRYALPRVSTMLVVAWTMSALPGCKPGPDRSKVIAAPIDGQYTVFIAGNSMPQQQEMLRKGDPVGFERSGNDLYIILGSQRLWCHPNQVKSVSIQANNFNLRP